MFFGLFFFLATWKWSRKLDHRKNNRMYGNWMKFSPTSKAGVGYIARPRASDTDPEMAPFVCGPCLLLVFSLYALVVQESLIRFWGHDLWVDFPFLHQLKSEKKKKTHISITLCVFLFAFINLISIDEVDFCNILKGKKTYREVIHLQVFLSW